LVRLPSIGGRISSGWPAVLSSLKSFLETGQGLEPTWVEEEKPWLK
jgi:hypothetical protein